MGGYLEKIFAFVSIENEKLWVPFKQICFDEMRQPEAMARLSSMAEPGTMQSQTTMLRISWFFRIPVVFQRPQSAGSSLDRTTPKFPNIAYICMFSFKWGWL